MVRVGQNRLCTPCMTVYLMISLPNVRYTDGIYMVMANAMYGVWPKPWLSLHAHESTNVCT